MHEPGVHDVGEAVVAMGVFDGVHIGHQALVRDTVARARAAGVASVVLTFDRDPDQVVTPSSAAPQLTALEDKLALLAALEPDAVLVVPFDENLAHLAPAEFLTRIVFDTCTPVACVVGADFRFGVRASGDVATLERFGEQNGFSVVAHDLVRVGFEAVTSTRIRLLIAAGGVADARRLLGRPHILRGRVVHGAAIGRELGFATANLAVDPRFALPATGVYAGWATTPAGRYPAAVSVGIPPTFPDATCELEAHLISFDGDLYGAELAVAFVERLRDQQAYPDRSALAAAISDDIVRIQHILASDAEDARP
jgi:riboflavin kinase/FMN adenylyltransferase